MLNTQATPLNRLHNGAFVLFLLAMTCAVNTPGFTYNRVESVLINRPTDERQPGDEIYLVIKPQLNKEVLDKAISMLKTKGVTLTYANEVYKDGKLAAIEVTIQVEAPGKGKLIYTLSQAGDENSFKPLIFYYEAEGQRIGFVNEAPADLSHRGKLVVTDNLVGVAILNGDNQQTHGRLTTTWKMR